MAHLEKFTNNYKKNIKLFIKNSREIMGGGWQVRNNFREKLRRNWLIYEKIEKF